MPALPQPGTGASATGPPLLRGPPSSLPPAGCRPSYPTPGTGQAGSWPSYLEAVPSSTIQAWARRGCGVAEA